MIDDPFLKARQEAMSMEEIWELENGLRALKRHLSLIQGDLIGAPDEPETAATMQLSQGLQLAIKLIVRELGYDLR